jgi:hypothetical protein
MRLRRRTCMRERERERERRQKQDENSIFPKECERGGGGKR